MSIAIPLYDYKCVLVCLLRNLQFYATLTL